MPQPSVALILPSLAGGGAERIGAELASHWAGQGRRVSLITIDAAESRYAIDPRVTRIGLGLMRVSRNLVSALLNNTLRVRQLRRAIAESGAERVVSFTDVTNVTSLLACRDLKLPVIVCERTEPRCHEIGRVWSRLRKRMYGRATAIVVQTEAVRSWAEAQGWRVPVYTIPNAAPQIQPELPDPEPARPSRPAIVALGRLSREKGMDLLIESFARIARDFPQWQLRIHGVGAERSSLEALAHKLAIHDRLQFAGWTHEPLAALRAADVFVLPSRYEGFPNALLEAMAMGVACVTFDCDSGPREIVRPEVDAILVPAEDVAGLARALARLLSDPELRSQLGAAARSVTSRFSRDSFHERWDAVLQLKAGSGGAAPQ